MNDAIMQKLPFSLIAEQSLLGSVLIDPTSLNQVADLISADDRLRVCFDTNHLLKEQNENFIRRVGDRIVTLHVSDYDRINERHWLPGEGVTDWNGILDALDDVGYNGVWLYEISLQCPNTISRPRDLTPADFARNASEVMARVKPTVIS